MQSYLTVEMQSEAYLCNHNCFREESVYSCKIVRKDIQVEACQGKIGSEEFLVKMNCLKSVRWSDKEM